MEDDKHTDLHNSIPQAPMSVFVFSSIHKKHGQKLNICWPKKPAFNSKVLKLCRTYPLLYYSAPKSEILPWKIPKLWHLRIKQPFENISNQRRNHRENVRMVWAGWSESDRWKACRSRPRCSFKGRHPVNLCVRNPCLMIDESTSQCSEHNSKLKPKITQSLGEN